MRTIQFTVPMTPTLNEVLRWHWRRQRESVKQMSAQVWVALKGKKPAQSMKRARVTIERHSSGTPDNDGLIGGLKHLIDTLVMPSKRNPHGLGLIENDDPSCIELVARSVRSNRAGQKTLVTVEELES